MELDKQKRTNKPDEAAQTQGTMWRSATNNYSIRGYEKQVMSHVQKTKNNPVRPRQQAPTPSNASQAETQSNHAS